MDPDEKTIKEKKAIILLSIGILEKVGLQNRGTHFSLFPSKSM